jgi:phospholipid transport system substrate-binding protein
MKTKTCVLAALAAIVFLAALPLQAAAASKGPMETLRAPLDTIISLLENPRYKNGANQKEQGEKLRGTVDLVFNYTEMSKRTLARYWKDFSVEERKEFRDLFAEFLANIYISKVQGNFSGEKVALDQEEITKDKAQVKSRIILKDSEIPVDYSMIDRKGDGTWEVYDVSVENISLIKNYRDQFSKILRKEKPADLIVRLRKKVEEQRAGKNVESEDISGSAGTGAGGGKQ